MAIGAAFRNAITNTIDSIGSSVTLTEYTEASSDGGYSGDGEVVVSTQSETAIPFEEFKSLIKQPFGNLEVAGTQIALKYDVEIDLQTKYKVTWQSVVYDVTRIQPYTIQDTIVAYIITISKRLNN